MITTKDIIAVSQMDAVRGISPTLLEDCRLILIHEGRPEMANSRPELNALADLPAAEFSKRVAPIREVKQGGPDPEYTDDGGAIVGDVTIRPLRARHQYQYLEEGVAPVLRDLTDATLEELDPGVYHACRRAVTFLWAEAYQADDGP